MASFDAGTPAWWEAVAKVNEVNGDHMAEEEREGLTDFRRCVSLQERHEIAMAFCTFEAAHALGITPRDVDPKDYIRDHEKPE
ncbi:MAG TPA: hypothetical protein VGN49_13960 [Micrococcaceae bacterium]|nr:hypothetical protein [Micrococcaceae bacterium]